MNTQIDIHALGPLLFRDARPFAASGDETRARSLPVPLPSTLAGFTRTVLGDLCGWTWTAQDAQRARTDITVRGFLLAREGTQADGSAQREWVLPAPRNAVPFRPGNQKEGPVSFMRLNPESLLEGEGCDLPHPGLRPVSITEDVKPAKDFVLWTSSAVDQWLRGKDGPTTDLGQPTGEHRVHIGVDPVRGTALEGRLFTVGYRVMEDLRKNRPGAAPLELGRWSFHVQARHTPAVPVDLSTSVTRGTTLGGEQRPVTATLRAAPADGAPEGWPAPSDELRQAVLNSTRLVLMLVTPALYADGWQPGWLRPDPEETPSLLATDQAPDPLRQAQAKLISAVVGRMEAVSGWNYESGRQGPKATRRAVPAGSMYFFELQRPLTPEELGTLWLQPTSDAEQDRNDGYGTAVWGVW